MSDNSLFLSVGDIVESKLEATAHCLQSLLYFPNINKGTIVRNKLLKIAIGISCATVFSVSHADIATINKYYKNPNTAPKVQRCKGNQDCNAFYALSKQWKSIPNCLKTSYGLDCETKKQAQDGDGYGLWKGGYFEGTYHLADAGEAVFYRGGAASKADERIFSEGLSVLYYLDSKHENR